MLENKSGASPDFLADIFQRLMQLENKIKEKADYQDFIEL